MRRLLAAVVVTGVAVLPVCLGAQGRGAGRGGAQAPPPPVGRAAAPYDISGYWVSLVTDDWRYRMLTPPKGNVDYLPVTAEGRRVAGTWDPAKDTADGQQCRAYGAGGIMRLPARLHITWENDTTLRMDIDAGTQTRRFFFDNVSQAANAQATLQGYSAARWDIPGARGQAPASGNGSRFGQLRVVTTRLTPGYVRKNGVPYGAGATVTENYVRLVDNGGQEYLVVTVTVDDPVYFQPPYIKTYEFKKQTDAAGWNPRPCVAK